MGSTTKDDRKVVLLIGTSQPSSLGASLALAFLESGYGIIATCRAPLERIRFFFEEKGCDVLELELGNEDSMQAAALTVEEMIRGKLNVLVNNASRRLEPRN